MRPTVAELGRNAAYQREVVLLAQSVGLTLESLALERQEAKGTVLTQQARDLQVEHVWVT